MAAVRRSPAPLATRLWAWLREPRAVAVSPFAALAAAAVLVVLAGAGRWAARHATSRRGGEGFAAAAAAPTPAPAVVTFVLVAPKARSVALAGDFDGWDRSRLPMRRAASGLWTLDVPLAPGRYQYAFVVDGRQFVADPAAPRAVGDDFGQPNSVVTVSGAARGAGGSL